MIKQIERHIQEEAYAIILSQLLGVAILSIALLLLFGQHYAFSFFVGGMAYGLPDLLFVWRFIRYSGVKAINDFMGRFYVGKMVKLILRSVLIVFTVKHLPTNMLWVVIGFVSCPFLFWAGCIMHFTRLRGAV